MNSIISIASRGYRILESPTPDLIVHAYLFFSCPLGTVRICRPTDLTLQRPGTWSGITHHNLGNQVPDVAL